MIDSPPSFQLSNSVYSTIPSRKPTTSPLATPYLFQIDRMSLTLGSSTFAPARSIAVSVTIAVTFSHGGTVIGVGATAKLVAIFVVFCEPAPILFLDRIRATRLHHQIFFELPRIVETAIGRFKENENNLK